MKESFPQIMVSQSHQQLHYKLLLLRICYVPDIVISILYHYKLITIIQILNMMELNHGQVNDLPKFIQLNGSEAI